MFYPKSTTILLWLLLSMLISTGAFAENLQLIPSLMVRGEYDDSIFGNTGDKVDDYITTLSPGLEFLEKTERLDVAAKAVVSPFYYADNSDLNDVDRQYTWDIGYRITELAGVNASARYDVSNRPDRDIETTGLAESNNRRKRGDYGLGFNYTLSELSAMSVSGGYSKEKWDQSTHDREDLEAIRASLNLTHNLSRWINPTIGRLNAGFTRYDYETSKTDYYFATIGVQHWFSETVNLLVDAGGRYVDADYTRPRLVLVPPSALEIRMVQSHKTSFGGVGTAILEIRGEVTTGSLRISHDIQSASSRGSTVQRSDAVLNFTRRLTRRSSASISGGYFINKADSDEYSYGETDEQTMFIRPHLRWAFSDKYVLEVGYNFSSTKDRVDGERWNRSLVYVQAGWGGG